MTSFRWIAAWCMLCSLCLSRKAVGKEYVSVEELHNSKAVQMKLLGAGGYSGYCIDMYVKNLKKDSIFLWLESGRRLDSEKPDVQDILVVKAQYLKLAPGQEMRVKVFGFCCQSHNHAPQLGDKFSVGRLAADSSWVKLARFMSKNNFPTHVQQSAVWVFSDNQALAGIEGNEANKPLMDFIADLKGIVLPWYYVQYKPSQGVQVFSDKHLKVAGKINYYIQHNCAVRAVVKDRRGKITLTLMDGVPHNSNEYDFMMNISVLNWPKGQYDVLFYADDNLILKKEFEL